jgi:hypothetical protein
MNEFVQDASYDAGDHLKPGEDYEEQPRFQQMNCSARNDHNRDFHQS